MCETLKELVNVGTFDILQEKLRDWLDNFKFNTCDQNVARGCEIIELNSKMQGQLFRLLNICASEGGKYGGASVIKNKLLPILGQGYFCTEPEYNSSISGQKYPEIAKNSIDDVSNKYEKPNRDFQRDVTDSKRENEVLRLKLEETKLELDRQSRESTSEKMFDKDEISQLKDQVNRIKSENEQLKAKSRLTETYIEEVEHLKDDVALLSTHRSMHGLHTPRCHPSCDQCPSIYSGCPLDSYHNHAYHCDRLCLAKEQHLVSQLNDLFSVGRSNAMDILASYSDDHENNQRIIFHAVIESFNATKAAFRLYKSKLRNDFIGHHGGCSLEDSVQNYIDIHADHDLDIGSVYRDVIGALNFKVPMIKRPSGGSFEMVGSLIKEVCRIAWSMICLSTPIDVHHPASDGELFDESRYRRSHDSDYNAVFVSHHVWPSLVKNGLVIAKGEVVTKKTGYIRSKSNNSVQSPILSPCRFSDTSLSSRLARPTPKSIRSKSPTLKNRF